MPYSLTNMALYTKESLETLRQRIDLVEVLSSHIDLKRSGAAFKALCPFHDEKTPSLMIQRGDQHYHCFGCGAHGDAIQFLMLHAKMSFKESIESLAHKFNVTLVYEDGHAAAQGPDKKALKFALERAAHLFNFMLLHTVDGQQALHYLYRRGIDQEFIQQFNLGLAPMAPGVLRPWMHHHHIKDATLIEAGLIAESASGGYRDFFSDRIMFPIQDAHGAVIAFSGRKYKEETFGGKYINTPETPLFKKSRVLFGLNYCRKRIAKERTALIVEGQLDTLRLIHHGFNIAVAGQGTAFGEGHALELIQLGVNKIFIATDNDTAGTEAACKIGNIFQREGIETSILRLPPKSDPDSYLCEYGPEAFAKLMETSSGYLEFLVKQRAHHINMHSPEGKTELVLAVSKQIREWKQPLMVHESLRKLAHLVQVPEDLVGVGQQFIPNLYIKKSGIAGAQEIDPNQILEHDALRWLLLLGAAQPHLLEIAHRYLKVDDFKLPTSKVLYQACLDCHQAGKPCDFFYLAASLEDAEAQTALSEILKRKVNKDRAQQQFVDTVQRILDRNWMEKRDAIRVKIQGGGCSDEEAMELARHFEALKRTSISNEMPC